MDNPTGSLLSLSQRRVRNSLVLAIAISVVVSASAFVAIRVGLTYYSPTSLALLRFLVASAALGVYALVTRMPMPALKDLPRLALTGLIGITCYSLALNTGEQTIPAGQASLLVNTSPIWTALIATVVLRERLRVWGWIGIAISFCGTAIITLGNSADLRLSVGAVWVLLAALAFSLYFIVQKPLLARYGPVQCSAWAIWFGTLFLLPFAPELARTLGHAPVSATVAVVYLGLFPGAVVYFTWSFVHVHLPASRAASFQYGVPVVAFFIGWIGLGEVPTYLAALGCVIALSGVILLNTRGRIQRIAGPVSSDTLSRVESALLTISPD